MSHPVALLHRRELYDMRPPFGKIRFGRCSRSQPFLAFRIMPPDFEYEVATAMLFFSGQGCVLSFCVLRLVLFVTYLVPSRIYPLRV